MIRAGSSSYQTITITLTLTFIFNLNRQNPPSWQCCRCGFCVSYSGAVTLTQTPVAWLRAAFLQGGWKVPTQCWDNEVNKMLSIEISLIKKKINYSFYLLLFIIIVYYLFCNVLLISGHYLKPLQKCVWTFRPPCSILAWKGACF